MKRSFAVVVKRDPESHWLVGEVVELPRCYTQPLLCKTLRGMGLGVEEYNRILEEP